MSEIMRERMEQIAELMSAIDSGDDFRSVCLGATASAEFIEQLAAMPGGRRTVHMFPADGSHDYDWAVDAADITINNVMFRAQRARPATAEESATLHERMSGVGA